MKRRLHLRRTNSSIRRLLIVILKKEQRYLCVDNTYSYTDRPFKFISFFFGGGGGVSRARHFVTRNKSDYWWDGVGAFGLTKKTRYRFFFKLYKSFSLTTTDFFFILSIMSISFRP